MAKLTIVSVAYPFSPVGVDSMGGAEQVLTRLDEAIVRAGHRSVVIARASSRTKGVLVPIPAEPIDVSMQGGDAIGLVHATVRAAISRVLDREHVDVIHMHGVDFDRYLPPLGPPVIATLHLPPSWYSREALAPVRPRTHLCSVSRAYRAAMPAWAFPAEVIENGVRLESFQWRGKRAGFCLMLSRIRPEIGVGEVIDAANEADVPLLAGGGEVSTWDAHHRYADDLIKSRLRMPHRWLGTLGPERRRHLLSAARALLVPRGVPETSSILVMEALASGTPVIAHAAGWLSLLVEHEKTGYIVSDASSMARAITEAERIAPGDCRRAAVARFSDRTMTARYLELYQSVARGTRRSESSARTRSLFTT